MKKSFRIANIILLILAMGCLFYYDHTGGLWLKGVTSGWFVLIGLVNLALIRKLGKTVLPPALLVAGLVLSAVADVALGISFFAGVAAFAAGHICYLAAFCVLEQFRLRDLIPTAIVGAISIYIVFFTPWVSIDDPAMKVVLVAYALIISFMLGKALGNLAVTKSRVRWLFAAGALLFWFSDLMLALAWFGSGGSTASALCMYTYWPGQYLLAHTLYHYAVEE